MNSSDAISRRAQARCIARVCRDDLQRAADLLDDGRHATGHEAGRKATVACRDFIDAVDGHERAVIDWEAST